MKFIKILILFFFILFTNQMTPQELSNVYNDFHNHIINDPYSYLKYKDELIRELKELNDKTDIKTRVYLINKLPHTYDIEKFLNDLSYHSLKGDKNKEINSIFVLFSIEDRKMRIRTGEKARKFISDSTGLSILESLKTNLKNKEYDEAIEELIDLIRYRLTTSNLKLSFYDLFDFMLRNWFFTLIIVLLIYTALHPKKSLDDLAKEKLEKIKKITQKHKNNKKKFVETTCIVCLDDLEEDTNDDKNPINNKDINDDKNSINHNKDINDDNSINHNKDLNKDKKLEDNYPPEESKEFNDEKKNQKKVFRATLECGHSFHSTCIANWMDKQNNCPVCREKIDKEDDSNNKPLSENLVNIHTHYHPTFNSLVFDYTTDTLVWSSPVRHTHSTSDSGSYDYSSWVSGSGGASSDW